MARTVKFGDRIGVSRDSLGETCEKKGEETMNKNHIKLTLRLGAALLLLGWTSWATAGKPQNTAHPCQVTVADRSGDSILSDGLGVYTDGLDVEARLWDMNNGVADHLFFQAPGGTPGSTRFLTLSIPGITNGVQTCASGTLQPNVNSSGYQFYDLLHIGQSTTGSQNYGGTLKCSYGPHGWDAVNVAYESQCIVITHTADKVWTITADSGCTAAVTKIQNRQVIGQWVGQNVPFQVQATELP